MTGIDMNAIDEPINLTGAELLRLLEADRNLAIALAEHHGLLDRSNREAEATTMRWLEHLVDEDRRKPCACCGLVHGDPKRVEAKR